MSIWDHLASRISPHRAPVNISNSTTYPKKRMMAFATFADQRDDLLGGKESLTQLSKLD